MANLVTAIRDESRSTSGNIVGNVAQSVFLDGKPIVLEGSVSSSGATVLAPKSERTILVEGRKVAAEGDTLSDGTVLLPRKVQK